MSTNLAAWNVAALRLEDYLRAHRVHDRERLLHLNLDLLDAAHRAHATSPDRPPLEITMELATLRVEAWFSKLAGDSASPDPSLAARGRAAWFASGLHREWPTAFLDPEPSSELLSAARSVSMQAGPALEFSSLLRTEMDYGPMEDIAGGTWQQFSWGHVLRAFFIWVFIFFVAYGAYLTFFASR
ncbi:MAG TPA: hypothetical protein VNB29_11705 [Chthoniobacterales bacterium]|nr:hypothetical protein [Chthoniobacterales bacterium]